MNGKFEEKYGYSWEKMDDDKRQMAIMSEIFDLREEMVPLALTVKDLCKRADNNAMGIKENRDRVKVLLWMVGVITVSVVGWLITNILEVVKIIN